MATIALVNDNNVVVDVVMAEMDDDFSFWPGCAPFAAPDDGSVSKGFVRDSATGAFSDPTKVKQGVQF